MRTIKKLVVHTSDSPDNVDIGVAEVRSWHVEKPPKGNGWSDVGYHYIIRRDGKVETGRKEETVGSHVQGHNEDSIGICWIGRQYIGHNQYLSLVFEIKKLLKKYSLSADDVYGHCELFSGKTCPNIDMDQFRMDLRT